MKKPSTWKCFSFTLKPLATRRDSATHEAVSAAARCRGGSEGFENNPGDSKSRLLICALVLGLIWAGVAEPVLATCGSGGCWSETVDEIRIAQDGKIWFLITTPATLTEVDTVESCELKTIYSGGHQPALFIPRDHPEYEHKYSMLMLAYTTGASIGFNMEIDPATGWCALGRIYVK